MSVQFGRWDFKGQPPASDYIERVNAALAPYGSDSNESYANGGLKILYRAFCTTQESYRERQPHVSASGAVITWDGRLDNRAELTYELRGLLRINSATAFSRGSNLTRINSGQVEMRTDSAALAKAGWGKGSIQGDASKDPPSRSVHTDVELVAGAYEKWGVECLGKLIGDWALSIWNPRDRSLILAKDFVGTRHLYYSIESDYVAWSTILDPLVLFAERTFEICEEYIAGFFSYFPAAHLTPYVGIQAVPPSSYALIRVGMHGVNSSVIKYWDFDSGKRIRYRTDGEYEDHFRSVLATAVRRRLRSDRPVLAELSGGMDSSSIVCMADTIVARGAAATPRLDTISWFDDSYDHIEPDTNELRWIAKVEEKRGRTGFHINTGLLEDVGPQVPFPSDFETGGFVAIPIHNCDRSDFTKHYAACMVSHGHRVTLSGIGGDEATGGGVPTPTPELQNLLARARFDSFARQLKAWTAKTNKSRLHLFWTAARGFFTYDPIVLGAPKEMRPAPWLASRFVRRNHAALCGYPSRVKPFGPLPSFQKHLIGLEILRRTLAAWPLRPDLLREIRWPYLDRDLLEFLYAVPREQLVGVGKRRFLMKRSLVTIVPDAILNRRRKAFTPLKLPESPSTEWASLVEGDEDMVSSSMGAIDLKRFREALQGVRCNEEILLPYLMHTLTIEFWLRHLTSYGILANSMPKEAAQQHDAVDVNKVRTPNNPRVQLASSWKAKCH